MPMTMMLKIILMIQRLSGDEILAKTDVGLAKKSETGEAHTSTVSIVQPKINYDELFLLIFLKLLPY